ncbi:MAG: hypothetical protein RBR87_03225 [Bacteroidales bacterium]|jgi:hypothetical protein|nr:hypothetical protein [Bacteroidales bacterium]
MKTKSILGLLLLILLSLSLSAQIDKMRENLSDAIIELEEGLLTLRFYDAETGDPVADAMVTISSIGDFTTDGLGLVHFPNPEKDGTYAVHVKKEGYITVDFPIEIVAQTIFYNRFSLSKKMPIGHLRIVLEWDKKPADLDVHFIKDRDYHISYRNMIVSADGTARLDRDELDGYGPETITVKKIDDQVSYRFYVHDYTNRDKSGSTRLSNSKASVKVYGDNKLLQTFKIPLDTEGVNWQVFTITNGQINPVNSVGNKIEP